ncbi:hypothetical protein [uncultured Microbacterium sp.]|uniref:hypothetical protein n=1 Tax=uncultured Microbacterium sp. TaxID=191216 RepID=UPI0025DB7D6E|nr:hypothetical protein [uncultured Microbacterium sp.]
MGEIATKARRGPNAVISFVIAGLFLILALWSAIAGEAWSIGLGVLGILWVFLGVRARKHRRPSR